MNTITNYYENNNEELRITTTNSRKIEFIVTTNILDQYIEKHHKILEVGAGTGVYSLYFAVKGNEVLATDITPKHVEIIKEKSLKNGNLKLSAELANATDLSQYESESFDIVTCLGPMYHLTEEADRTSCISEALRVLKKGGLLAIAYVNKHFVLHHIMLRNKSFLTQDFIDKVLHTGVIKDGQKECFWTDAFFTSPSEIEQFIEKFDTKILEHVGTDGLNPFLRDCIDEMTPEEYNHWIYYILNSCKEKSILGMSNHGLLLCRKN